MNENQVSEVHNPRSFLKTQDDEERRGKVNDTMEGSRRVYNNDDKKKKNNNNKGSCHLH